MRIGLVLSNTPAQSETFFISKIKGLQENGYEVVLFASQTEDFRLCRVIPHPEVIRNPFTQLTKMIISYIVLFLKRPFIFLSYLNHEKKDGITIRSRWENLYINSHILKENLDWLHFGFATMAIRRENVARVIGARMGVSIRGYDICVYPLKHPGCYQRLWDKVDKIHSISDDLLEFAKEQGLKNHTPQVIIKPAIDLNYFKTREKNWEKFNSEGTTQLLTVGRLHWKKGLEYTLQALAILEQKSIPFKYTIVGDGEERERLIFISHQMGLENRVTFTGSIQHDEIIKYYKEADIYLQYSIQEGFCNAVLEAQAVGLLTIVSDAEGLPENVINNITGWVLPKRNPVYLSKKIMEVINLTTNKKFEISLYARKRMNKRFSLNIQSGAFNSFYSDMY